MATTTNAKSIPYKTGTMHLSKGAKPSNDFLMPYNKGIVLLHLGKYNESIAYFDKVLAINPKDITSLDSKGAALLHLGKYNESIVYFDKVLAINPKDISSLGRKGYALFKLGIYNESIVYFDKVLALNPTNSIVLADKKLALDAWGIPQDPSKFGFYFIPTNITTTSPTNAHTQKPILTCDQPGQASCYSFGYSKGLLNTQTSCSAATLNSFVIANPSQVTNFCSGYRVAAQQTLQRQG